MPFAYAGMSRFGWRNFSLGHELTTSSPEPITHDLSQDSESVWLSRFDYFHLSLL